MPPVFGPGRADLNPNSPRLSAQPQEELIPRLLRRREGGADDGPAHEEDPRAEEENPPVRGEV